MSGNGNECILRDQKIVIKCARVRTTKIGVSLHMLRGLTAVLGAFEKAGGEYHILQLSASQFADAMEPTRSKGPSAGKVGMVTRATFERNGIEVARVRI
jgi:hypothetical protein